MNQTAIVTGAASGVGKECTRMLVAKGYRVAAMDLHANAIAAAFPEARRSCRLRSTSETPKLVRRPLPKP
jgi:NAD(P)-dependent dehydrogenase (short-subunit alcohol dehydrogenase family)